MIKQRFTKERYLLQEAKKLMLSTKQSFIIKWQNEFDAKPELEIYADDVKCSHGSTSGNIDLNLIHYLKSRGIPEKEAYQKH